MQDLERKTIFLEESVLAASTAFISQFNNNERGDFPGGAVAKNLPANAGDTGSSPGPGRSYMPRSN